MEGRRVRSKSRVHGLSDWDAELERANGEIAELHVRISFQKEIVKQLAAAGADTMQAQRILEIREERLARAIDHQRFIASQIGKGDTARSSSRGDPSSEPLRFRWDQ
jgi:hypothetical protein